MTGYEETRFMCLLTESDREYGVASFVSGGNIYNIGCVEDFLICCEEASVCHADMAIMVMTGKV